MLNRITDRARHVVRMATVHANSLQHAKITAPHVFLSLLNMTSGNAHAILGKLVVDLPQMRRLVESQLRSNDHDSQPSIARVVEIAAEEARLLNHNYIGTEHLLLAVLSTEPQRQAARRIFKQIAQPSIATDAPEAIASGLRRATLLGTTRNIPIFIAELSDSYGR